MSFDSTPQRSEMQAMKVSGFLADPQTGHPTLILSDPSGERFLPIVIGPAEASSIALALQDSTPPRPLSHDLMKSIIDATRASVKCVVIHDIRESTFLARVELESAGQIFDLDARPSDGIALALRADAPIFVTSRIPLATAHVAEEEQAKRDDEAFKAFIESLKPSDFSDGQEAAETES